MKKQSVYMAFAFMTFTGIGFANCDLTRFRWACDLPVQVKPTRATHSLVYCGNVPMVLSTADYDRMIHEQRSDLNMTLTINGEYITSPCVPAGRNGRYRY